MLQMLGAASVPRPTGASRVAPYSIASPGSPMQAPQVVPPPPAPSRARPSMRPGLPPIVPPGSPNSWSASSTMPPPIVASRVEGVASLMASTSKCSGAPMVAPTRSAPKRGYEADSSATDYSSSEHQNSESGFDGWGKGGSDGKGGGKGGKGSKGGGKGSKDSKGKGKKAKSSDSKGEEGGRSRETEDDWQEDFYRLAFVQDPWEELYAQHSTASHLRAHLDLERDTQKEVEMEEEKALAAMETASAKESLDARLQALGLQKAAAVATELAEKAAASAEAAATAKAKDEPKATSIYDFFEDGDDNFM